MKNTQNIQLYLCESEVDKLVDAEAKVDARPDNGMNSELHTRQVAQSRCIMYGTKPLSDMYVAYYQSVWCTLISTSYFFL